VGSVSDFNRYAAQGRAAAEKYCKDWSRELDVKGKELSELLKNKQIDTKSYNMKRSLLNSDIRDLNSCIAKINKK